MSASTTSPESIKQAFAEMHCYLADEIAPFQAAEPAELLMGLPAKYGAELIRRWLEQQLSAPDRVVSLTGYVYHAVRKFHLLAEFGVVDPRKMGAYVLELSKAVSALVPDRERAELKIKLSRITETEAHLTAPVSLLNKELQAGEARPLSVPVSADAPVPAPRPRSTSGKLRLLLDRLGEISAGLISGASGTTKEASRASVAQLVARGAAESADAEQLRSFLAGLRDAGVETKLDRKMFGMMAEQIPDWAVKESGSQVTVTGASHLLQAMQQLVVKSATREETVERFGEIVYAAIDQLNEGHLAQSVAMFDVAQRLIDDKKIDPELARSVKGRAEEAVAVTSLRQFAAAPAKHGLLRKVLAFFPAFSPQELLTRLDGEPKRETRKLLLSILEVHGSPCRPLLLERLDGYLTEKLPDPHGWYSRNVVFLLRRIPRAESEDMNRELDYLREFSQPERPFMVTKEAMGALAAVSIPEAEQLLIQRLREFEHAAMTQSGDYTAAEYAEILDRTCVALVSWGSIDSIRQVVVHTNLQDPKLGDTYGRIRTLSAADLSNDGELLKNLVDALRKTLPARVLGLSLLGRSYETDCLIEAISGTHDPMVTSILEEIVERFGKKSFGELAAKTLEKLRIGPARQAPSSEVVAGDLEMFGLPTLLQSLADGRQTGRLWIATSNGQPRAAMLFRDGKIAACNIGPLKGLDAVSQLIERPLPGSFRFERVLPADLPQRGLAMDVLATLMEAMRRHDEFQQDRAIVPEGTSLMPGDRPASTPEDESDEAFVKAVWREAARGTAPQSCEEIVCSDAYRVRRLYAHWLENGALKRRAAA